MHNFIEDNSEELNFYECNLPKVKQKIKEASDLIEKINVLIAEAASGGKHDTGCFSDSFDEKTKAAFGEAQMSLFELNSKLKSVNYHLKKY